MTVTLLPTAKRQNIQTSWNVYVDAQFGATFSGSIDYGDPTFDEVGKAEWISVHLVGPASTVFGRRINTTDNAQGLVYMPQINIFVRPAQATTIYRLHTLRDLVAASLKSGLTIPVLDYAGDSSAIGSLIVRKTNLDQAISGAPGQAPEDLQQWAYGVDADWVETWQP